MDGGYVFISYARPDKQYVTRLVEHLEAHGVPTWHDEKIANGLRWAQVLRSSIERAAAVLLVESAHAQASRWVEQEIIHAERHRKPLLLLLLEG